VSVAVEVGIPEDFLGAIDGLVLDEDRAQNRPFGFQVVREIFLEGNIGASEMRRRFDPGSPPGNAL
jgi:hypothetical protein